LLLFVADSHGIRCRIRIYRHLSSEMDRLRDLPFHVSIISRTLSMIHNHGRKPKAAIASPPTSTSVSRQLIYRPSDTLW
jgi:hypothetical protein